LRFPNLPISARLPASDKISAKQSVDFNQLRPATLLVADDNQANRDYISGIFQKTHHRLIFCARGDEAVAKARENVPDLILLDLQMPGLGGEEALAQIRKIPGMELVPAIAVTGSLQPDDSFSSCLRKPFSTGELFERLAEFLPRHTPVDPSARPETRAPEESAGPAPRELLAQLRQRLADPWPTLRESMAVNEIRAFARQLEILAEQWHFKPLLVYAGQLLRDAEAYSVIDLEKHLGEFPARVEQFAQNKEKIMTDERQETGAPSAAETAGAAAPVK
jgi:CheY-like chemotaxis protein